MKKQFLNAPLSETSANVSDIVNVSDIDGLYNAVNDPNNAGKTIVLAPNTYSLSANYPKGGRLELLFNMSLMGKEGHPNAVVIDVSGLSSSSYIISPPPQVNTAPIRMGNGTNKIEWMTIRNNPTNAIRTLIQTDLVDTPGTRITVAHTILTGASIGLCLINRYAECDNRIVEADIEENEIMANTAGTFKSGIQVQNSHGVTHAAIHARLKKNRIHSNGNGLAAFNAGPTGSFANDNIIMIKSDEDVFELNGVGLALIGGNSSGGTANGNSTSFEANGTTIKNNTGTPSQFDKYEPGGVFAVAGLANQDNVRNMVNDNKLKIRFKDCAIENNLLPLQIKAYGAHSKYATSVPIGSNNSNKINLHGISAQSTINAVNSKLNDFDPTNTVELFVQP